MKKLMILSAILLFALSSCKKEEVKVETVQTNIVEPQIEETQTTKIDSEPSFELKTISVSMDTKFQTDAHQQYLNDEFAFENLQFENINSDISYLVASDKCELYSEDCFKKNDDGTYDLVSDNMTGTPVPFGTVLEPADYSEVILKKSKESDLYYTNYGYFYFQDNYNFFYKVRYNDQTGYVFGADLHHSQYNVLKDTENNVIYSELLLKEGALDKFFSYIGNKKLNNEKVKDSLTENRLALQHYSSPYISSDDLIDSYRNELYNKYTPIFITTDLFSHSQHLVFDRILQRIEENYFVPSLLEVTQKYISALQNETDVPEEVKSAAIKYFQVPELILRLAPKMEYQGEGWRKEVIYIENLDAQNIIAEYPEDVIADYKQVMNAEGIKSAIFDTEEMFNQYKPRGHYTKNGVLEAYFRAQMWFGRIHFVIAQSDFNPETDIECAKMEPIAMFIVNTVHKNPELYEAWKNIFDPITTLIGESDDLSFDEIMPLWSEENVDNFTAWTNDKEKLQAFVKICHEKLRPPAISGNSVFTGPSETDDNGNIKPPMGWRFLGQRFTYDSYIHQNVCAPTLFSRDFVRGLDIMKVFGSNTAEALLSLEDYQTTAEPSEFYGGQQLKDTLDNFQQEFESYDSSFWTKNYYNSVLGQIKTQATFEQGAGFYFTESPMWNIKSMISSHSTWAELRHDTILYVKQSVAERAGDGDMDPTFRTKEIPLPVNYIEPNLPFWQISANSIEILTNTLDKYNFFDARISQILDDFAEICNQAIIICEKEINDEPITENENRWIRTIPNILSNSVMIEINAYANNKKDLQMACIADVFTNNEKGVCLEVGIGEPLKIYVPLNDKQGGKRIAIGFIPDYFEFYYSADDRLTDDEWKDMVYKNKNSVYQYEPFWEKSCILPSESN